MDRLLHNLIADMPGPVFLFLYGLVIVLTLAVCWSRRWPKGIRTSSS